MTTNNYNRAKAVKVQKSGLSLDKSVKFDRRGLSNKLLAVVLACFILGMLVGGLGLYALTKHDCFEMVATANHEVDLVIGPDEAIKKYTEPGVKCVAFGKNAAGSVKVSYQYRENITQDTREVDAIDPSVEGIYYVVYTSTNFKYRNVQLVRNVIVLRTED